MFILSTGFNLVLWFFLLVPNAFATELEIQDIVSLNEIAQFENPKLIGSKHLDEYALFKQRESLGALLPQVNIETSRSYTEYESNTSQFDYYGSRSSLVASQAILNLPAWYNYDRHKSLTQKTNFQSHTTRLEQTQNLVKRYLDVLLAENTLRVTKVEIETVEQNLSRITSLYQKQLATVTDLLKAQSRLDSLKADALSQTASIDVARESLAELVGKYGHAPLANLKLESSLVPLIPVSDLSSVHASALKDNPSVKMFESNIEAERLAYKAAQSQHAPKITLRLASQASNIGYDNIQTNDTDSNSATLLLQVPIYAGGSTSAASNAAKQNMLIAKEDLKFLKRQITKETRTAYQKLKVAQLQIKASDTALKSAISVKNAAEKSFKYGLVNNVDILQSIQNLSEAELAQLKSRYDVIANYVDLKFYLGTLNKEDLELINSLFTKK